MTGIASSQVATPSNVNATTGVVKNVSLANADTEYDHSLPAGIKRFILRNRGSGELKISFTENESGTVYFTLYAGEVFDSGPLGELALTIYFQSSLASQTVEVIEWS